LGTLQLNKNTINDNKNIIICFFIKKGLFIIIIDIFNLLILL
jgi:hypothetical protein